MPVAVGVAVAILDEAGNIVAAGSGGDAGRLARGRGARRGGDQFPFVFRNFSKAKTFTITMEVEPKPGTATPTPPSAP